jgi:hypothetical protein
LQKNNVESLAGSLDLICADKDFKSAMGKLTSIQLKVGSELSAKVSGTTMTVQYPAFSALNGPSYYQSAIEAAL